MNNIEMIIKLMEPELNALQLAKLKNVLQTILRTSRNAPPNEELVERFIRHKKLVGLKDTSLTGYVNEVRRLQEYVGKGYCDITTADIKDYLANLVAERHISGTTLQSRIRYLSSFFDFLVNEEYIDRVLEWMNQLTHPGYYTRMGVAWCVATAYARCPEQTKRFLENNRLDDWTYHKTIRKMCESYCVPEEDKRYWKSRERG